MPGPPATAARLTASIRDKPGAVGRGAFRVVRELGWPFAPG